MNTLLRLLSAGLLGCASLATTAREPRPVTDAMLAAPAGADWLAYRGNLANWGYSELAQIDARNVAGLTLAWSWPLDAGINQTTPLVHDGVLYVVNPGGAVQALDAARGDLVWEYRRKPPADLGGVVWSPTRGLALYGDSVFSVTTDGHLVALDARTGGLRWEVATGDYHTIMQSSGPLAARGKVFTGRSCTPQVPGGCYLLAHDAATGRELWRRYVVPRPGEPGDETWGGLPLDARRHVGAWGPGAYDPALNLLYWGTSVPAPSNEAIRGTPGADMLYTNSTLALDADTGRIVWYQQHLPRDNWDLDHTGERILVDARLAPDAKAVWSANPRLKRGESRHVLTGIPGKTGIVWTLDRATGEFLWARETVRQNVITRIEPDTGRAVVNEAVIPDTPTDAYGLVCPSNKGGKVWQTASYSPRSRALFLPLVNLCMQPVIETPRPTPADLYGLSFNMDLTPGEQQLGRLQAVSVETGRTLWTFRQQAGTMSTLATAGGLVFAGDSDRRFRAHDARTGRVLWETVLQGPVSGAPIAFEADGTQYVAVAAGGGDWLTVAYNGLAGLPTVNGNNMLYVFALPGRSRVPRQGVAATMADGAAPAREPAYQAAQSARGREAYVAHCQLCHAPEMRGGHLAPALRGEFFARRWGGKPLADFFNVMHRSMPLQSPGSLDRHTVADILAYWAELNGYPASDTELSADPAAIAGLRIRAPAR